VGLYPGTPLELQDRSVFGGTSRLPIDRDGLAGGTFLTCKDALRFALFETGGDSAHVHTHPEPEGARDGARAHRRTRALQ